MTAKNRFKDMKRNAKTLLTAGALMLPSVLYGCKKHPVAVNDKPVANFVANPKDGYVPLEVCFDGSSSRPNGAQITKFIWQFEPGVTDQNSGARVCHAYMNPGNYNAGLVVEDSDGQRSSQDLEQIIARDGNPVISIQNLNSIEDKISSLDLTGKVTSPIYPLSSLTITATSPELNVTFNGPNMSYTNKTKDFNGNTYIDVTARDSEDRQRTSRIPVSVAPQTDVRGYLEHVLTGQRISVPLTYGTQAQNVDANGNFDFQADASGNLEVRVPINTNNFTDISGIRFLTNQFYNLSIPVNANGQDVNLGNVQLIPRARDNITGEDLLSFMKTYMLEGRWDDADLPIKVFIDNNAPSAEYREAVRKGVMDVWQPVVNQWLPTNRQIILAEIVPTEPAVGIRVDYTAISVQPNFTFGSPENIFKKGVMELNPNTIGNNAISRITVHEKGHGLGFSHTPYQNQIMCGACPSLPSDFEGLVTATKYKLKNGFVKYHSQ